MPQKETAMAWEPFDLQLNPHLRICLGCGLLWGGIDRVKTTRIVRTYGTDELKQRVLGGFAALPLPVEFPAPDANTLPRPVEPPDRDASRLPIAVDALFEKTRKSGPEAPTPWWRFWKR
jgi:hypothetical protein